jgi:hypothetical protein
MRKLYELQKVNDRCRNVVENKGRVWKTQRLTGNVIENKGSYVLKAGMLLKRKEVDGRWGKNRRQDSGLRIQVTSTRARGMLNYEF